MHLSIFTSCNRAMTDGDSNQILNMYLHSIASKSAADGVEAVIFSAKETIDSEIKGQNVPADFQETSKALKEDIATVVEGGNDKNKVIPAARKLAADTAVVCISFTYI